MAAFPPHPTRCLIFDLDGTLVDSVEDIAGAVNELLERLGRAPLPLGTIRGYVGHGVRRLLERALGGADEGEIAEAVELYLPIYRRRLLEHTRPFPGVVEALEALERDHPLAVLTNKPRRESVMILKGLFLDRFFRAVYGGDSFDARKPSPVGVARILEELERRPEEALFVGDSAVDMETARNASVRSCLVTYGLGHDEARKLEPDLVVEDLRELVAAVSPR